MNLKFPTVLGLAATLASSVMATSVVSVDVKSAADANNELAFKLLAKTSVKEGVVFSPYSVWSALTLVSAGAKGKTLAEMQDVLGLPKTPGIYNAASVWAKQLASSKDIELSVANRLWLQSGLALAPGFSKIAQEDFGAGLAQVDFVHSAAAVTGEINGWVEKQTHDRIKNLLQSGDLDASMRLVVTNAVYFKARWESPFNHAYTSMRPFHPETGGDVQASMMTGKKTVLYGESSWAQTLRLPYEGGQTSMVIVLPSAGVAPSVALAKLDAGSLKVMLKSMQSADINIVMPRFQMDQKLALAPTLQALGMKDAFSNQSDFSGITKAESLKIAKVIHQAFIKVGEDGTEAAAATAITMMPHAAMRHGPEPKWFVADRPFVYFIMDDRTGGILFAGAVAKPVWKD